MQTQELPRAGREVAFVSHNALLDLVAHHGLERDVVVAHGRLPSGLYGLHLRLEVSSHETKHLTCQAEKPATVKRDL